MTRPPTFGRRRSTLRRIAAIKRANEFIDLISQSAIASINNKNGRDYIYDNILHAVSEQLPSPVQDGKRSTRLTFLNLLSRSINLEAENEKDLNKEN